jgi:hypothetical protein
MRRVCEACFCLGAGGDFQVAEDEKLLQLGGLIFHRREQICVGNFEGDRSFKRFADELGLRRELDGLCDDSPKFE